jgi:flagellar basal-body rod modification protein FlgD
MAGSTPVSTSEFRQVFRKICTKGETIMHQVSANYTMPTILNSLNPIATKLPSKSATPKSNTASATNTSSSTSSSSSAGGLGTTFLTLLAQELQNQDPTAPVDPTAMVGQMISLNQLEQLITINQTLSGPVGSTPTSGAGAGASASTVAGSSALGGIAGMLSPSTSGAATSQLPFDPNTMMPLSSGNSGAVAASINSSINAANMGFSGTNNNTSGGN